MVLKKNSEWEKITTEFNASHGVNQRTCIQLKSLWKNMKSRTEFNASHGVNQRTCIQLKSLWKNMKSRTKSAVAKDRRERTKTGGGPQSETGLDTVSAAISTMLPQQINSLSNEFDDDASLHGDVQRTSSTNEAANRVTESNEASSSSSSSSTAASVVKKKRPQGNQEQVKGRLFEMAEEEHAAKMRIYKLKEDILNLKKRKLEESMATACTNETSNRPSASKEIAWRPF
ncbi:myb/SANT-like DNA-binding domain-containing protein 3 [Saccostrea cucullata]|uniref:myb/SANT-like DNA-binding domain-containing protein 3 n=1 Tax=Saccostrea cuccullata TaxID=36930 RepID=UPI002ECFCDA2